MLPRYGPYCLYVANEGRLNWGPTVCYFTVAGYWPALVLDYKVLQFQSHKYNSLRPPRQIVKHS